jgi:hypothetical protein
MQCPNCKSVIDEDSLFCPHCAYTLHGNRWDSGSSKGHPPFGPSKASTKNRIWIAIGAGSILLVISSAVFLTALYVYSGNASRLSPFKSEKSDAEAFARKGFEQQFTKCEDSYFAYKAPWGLVEYKDVTLDMKQMDLNNADRLNGIEWKGVANFNCDLTRLYDYTAHKWSDWTAKNPFLNPDGNVAFYTVAKRQGQWSGIDFGPPSSQKKLRCDELPK